MHATILSRRLNYCIIIKEQNIKNATVNNYIIIQYYFRLCHRNEHSSFSVISHNLLK